MTTMNTGAASLSDERERAAITACALMIKGICLTRPNAEWTGAIEDRIQFMLKQMQAGAAIAAGGAQEAADTVSLTGAQLLEAFQFVAPDHPNDADQLECEVTIQRGNGHDGPGLYCWITEYPEEGAIRLDGAPTAASNGEQA